MNISLFTHKIKINIYTKIIGLYNKTVIILNVTALTLHNT